MRSDDISLVMSESIPAAIVLSDLDGQRLYANPFFSVITGVSEEELLEFSGDVLSLLTIDEEKERLDRARRLCLLGEETSIVHRIRHNAGLTLWLETQFIPILGSEDEGLQGEVSAVMTVSTDVTRLKNYERVIEEQNRDLHDFTYMVSHDLKAPVFTIKGMAEALREDCGDQLGPTGTTYLEHIISGAARLQLLIASILEYSSLSTKESQVAPVALAAVLQQVISDQTGLIKETQARISIPQALPMISADGVRLSQVFSNLFGNALKYRSPERAPVILVAVHLTDTELVITVTDNGTGIPAELVKDIFRPYQRAHKGRIEGSGVGLACVKKIISRMDGDVQVESTVGVGSVFTIKFPRSIVVGEEE